MNQRFRSKLDELHENEPFANHGNQENAYKKFETIGHIRNLVLTWPNGRQKNCNYAYLVTSEYLPDESCIVLYYTSETIKLVGVNLANLHRELRYQLPEEIICIDKRYVSTLDDMECAVFEIQMD